MLARGELELETRLAASLQQFFEARGHWSEGRRWLEAGLHRVNELPVSVRAKAVYSLARFIHGSGDHSRAGALYTEASELFRQAHDDAGVVRALALLGWTERYAGDLERAEALAEESIALARTIDDSQALSDALHGAGLTALKRGDRRRAQALIQESITLSREIGDAIRISVSLVALGWLNLADGDLGLATTQFDEALLLAREVNDTEAIASALNNLGLLALRLSDYDRADELFAESLALASAMDDRELIAGDFAGLAAAGANKHPDQLARLLGASEGVHEAVGITFDKDEEWIRERFGEAARTELGEDLFSTEWAKGKGMSLEQAVEYALGLYAGRRHERKSFSKTSS
jgi:tetratricopeptide (TPR) repeat protein